MPRESPHKPHEMKLRRLVKKQEPRVSKRPPPWNKQKSLANPWRSFAEAARWTLNLSSSVSRRRFARYKEKRFGTCNSLTLVGVRPLTASICAKVRVKSGSTCERGCSIWQLGSTSTYLLSSTHILCLKSLRE